MKTATFIEDWIKEGIEQGMEQGFTQGHYIGVQQKNKQNIVTVLKARFDEIPPLIERFTDTINDVTVLDTLLIKAATALSMTEFQQALIDYKPPATHLENGIQVARERVTEVLMIRFGDLPKTIVKPINNMTDSALLKTLYREAVMIESVAEFEQLLSGLLPEEKV